MHRVGRIASLPRKAICSFTGNRSYQEKGIFGNSLFAKRKQASTYQYENPSSAAANLEPVEDKQILAQFTEKNARSLSVDLRDQENVSIELLPTWSDQEVVGTIYVKNKDATLTSAESQLKLQVKVSHTEKASQTAHTAHVGVSLATPLNLAHQLHLRIQIPQLCDVDATAVESITARDKIEGDLRIHSVRGNVQVTKARGEVVRIEAPKGSVNAGTLESTDMRVSGLEVVAKKLMTKTLLLQANELGTVGACYAHSAEVDCGQVNISNVHGNSKVRSLGSVELSGVTGDLDVDAQNDVNISLHSMDHRIKVATTAGSVTLTIPEESHGNVVGSVVVENETKLELPKGSQSNLEMTVMDDSNVRFQGLFYASSQGSTTSHASGSGKINFAASRNSVWEGVEESRAKTNEKVEIYAPNGSVKLTALSWMDSLRQKMGP